MTAIAPDSTSSDSQLLSEFATTRSEHAFAEIVRRYVDLVFATSLRRVRDRHLAEDVTQAVFLILAQRADSISSNTMLPGWLHRTAVYASSNALKMEARRKHHERQVPARSEGATEWQEIEPELDDAIARLSETDRNAIVLRFHQQRSIDHVASALGISVEAAKKRVQRALEKLRRMLSGKVATTSTAALATALSEHAAVANAAPADLAASISVSLTTAASSAIAKGTIHMIFLNQLKLAAIWIITIGLLVSGGVGMLLRSTPPATPHETSADGLSFGPVVELTVFDDGNHHDECIDFDKGKTISGPQGSFKTREEGARWFRESGADCHCETQTGESGLYPVQTWMIPVEREMWDQIPPAELQADMQSPPTRPVVSAEGELPVTFVFKTRDGAIGVGQIVEMDRGAADEHGTMKVRFKLVRGEQK